MSEVTESPAPSLPASMAVTTENLHELLPPVDQWPRWRKTAVTSAIRLHGPFTVQTSEGPLKCEDGWLAVDARGYPYPIADDEFPQIYVPITEDDEAIFLVPGVSREDGEPNVMVQWGPQVSYLPPEDVRALGMNAIESAEVAETEALLYRWLRAGDSMDDEKAAKLLYSFREFRSKQSATYGTVGDGEPA